MKTVNALALLFIFVAIAGCGGSNEATIVVDKNEAEKYNVPEDVMEQEMAAGQAAAKADSR